MVKFFWERWHRANTMDAATRINGGHSHTWIVAMEWIDAYKATLSKSKLAEFEKEWNKLEQQLTDYQNGKKGSINPLGIG